ncbi:zinc finger protein 789-like [Coccinella septempunctata]|uniref:zinc finger protein 789-like n=1 Tax=Coccinella septempunctata TaxID=41139 RepID=UPI001D083CA6|nr:zinc finger protein 789-like [Coccinella septempunctata]
METPIQDDYKAITFLNNTGDVEDGSSAIFMDGQYFIPANTKTILLPDDETQYLIHNTGDILFNCTDDNAIFNSNEVFHLVNNIENEEVQDQNQIVYFTNDVDVSPKGEISLMDVIEPSMIKNKTETEFLNLGSILDVRNENEFMENDETNGLQYIVQLQNFNSFQNAGDVKMENISEQSYNTFEGDVESSLPVDISKITGKNLLTGQTVTLDSYLEKVRNSSKELILNQTEGNSRRKNEQTALSNLLNKKLTIGKTLKGQRLIGKVIHVGKKDAQEEQAVIDMQSETVEELHLPDEIGVDLSASYYDAVENHVPNSVIIEDNQNDEENILLENMNEMLILDRPEVAIEFDDRPNEDQTTDDKKIDEHMVEYVTKTMSNLMNMEVVLKKLKRKNLLIKVLERVIEDDQVKVNTSQVRGHLEMLGGWQKHEYEEKWVFKMDTEKGDDGNDEWLELWSRKFPETMKLAISIIKVDDRIKSTKVNLNYNLEKCNVCSKGFKSTYKLRTHMKLSHNVDYQYRCQICDQSLENKEVYYQHRKYHVDMKELFPCTECGRHFLNVQKLLKHLSTHSNDGLRVNWTVCGESTENVSTWKEDGCKNESSNKSNKLFQGRNRSVEGNIDVKNCYVCKVCNRTFSRYSNLQRHSEIHGTKNSMAIYSCSMCGCTYNYISSLTRHIVQNHISAT